MYIAASSVTRGQGERHASGRVEASDEQMNEWMNEYEKYSTEKDKKNMEI